MFAQRSTRRRYSLLLCLLALAPSRIHAQTKEYQIKAAFLFNFAQFVEWPSSAFTNASAPLRIGILGDDPFGATLDEIVKGEKVNGHPLVVQRYRRIEEIKDCQILFVKLAEGDLAGQLLARLQGRNILTVGDVGGFIKEGGVIRFVTEENKIHFRVSLEAAKSAHLTMSSKMLRLAEIVEPGKD